LCSSIREFLPEISITFQAKKFSKIFKKNFYSDDEPLAVYLGRQQQTLPQSSEESQPNAADSDSSPGKSPAAKVTKFAARSLTPELFSDNEESQFLPVIVASQSSERNLVYELEGDSTTSEEESDDEGDFQPSQYSILNVGVRNRQMPPCLEKYATDVEVYDFLHARIFPVRVEQFEIEGRGLVATRDIASGEIVCEYCRNANMKISKNTIEPKTILKTFESLGLKNGRP
jgi:hypothetical protein